MLEVKFTTTFWAADLCNIFTTAFPSHFSDFVSGDWDAETTDVFVQCITFKDIIYG